MAHKQGVRWKGPWRVTQGLPECASRTSSVSITRVLAGDADSQALCQTHYVINSRAGAWQSVFEQASLQNSDTHLHLRTAGVMVGSRHVLAHGLGLP